MAKMDNTDYQRIKEIMDFYKISKLREFARKCNVLDQTLYDIKRGKTSISQTTAYKITMAFPDLNMNWISSGEGEMFRAKVNITDNSHDNTYGDFSGNVAGGDLNMKVPKSVEELAENLKVLADKFEKVIDEIETAKKENERLQEMNDKLMELLLSLKK